jgi:Protein of unknown function (DUF2934)
MYAATRLLRQCVAKTPFDEKLRSEAMPKVKTSRASKAKTETNVLQMPENGNGNGNSNHLSPVDLESEIRLRAYELYEQRGYLEGYQEQDWIAAEQEVRARHNQKHTA